jgi:hypothetical protein
MRKPVLAAVTLLGTLLPTLAQEAARTPTGVPPRFGLPVRAKTFPQGTAKDALRSAIEAAEKNEYTYLLAHLMDPQFVDARLTDRARQLEPFVEVELAKLREYQKANPDRVPRESRVPDDPGAFRAYAANEARTRAFRQLVRDVTDKLTDDPQSLKDLRRFLREGTFTDVAGGVRVTLADVKDRSVFLRQIGDRWFVENRQVEEGKKEPEEKKTPEDKKGTNEKKGPEEKKP